MPIKIAALAGSLRADSFTCKTLRLALKEASKLGAEVLWIDLHDYKLPFCDGSDHYPAYPDVERLRNALRSVDALFIATPEYHGSLSGVLKNTLDLLDGEEVKGKPIALISVVGGTHSSNALNTLRIIFRQVHALVIPEQLTIPHAEEAFTPDGFLHDAELSMRLTHLVSSLISITSRLKS